MAFQDGINELNVWLYNALGRCSTLAAENGDLTKALADKTAELEQATKRIAELEMEPAVEVPDFVQQVATAEDLMVAKPKGNGTLHDWGRHSPNSDPGSFTSLPEPQDL